MKSFFNSTFFVNNRKALLIQSQAELIVISANGNLQSNGDVTFPFRQDSNFWYLTGLDEPDLLLVIDQQSEYLILPERNKHQVVFDGALNNKYFQTRSGIKTVLDHQAGWSKLEQQLSKYKKVGLLEPAPAYIESQGFFTNPARAELLKQLQVLKPKLKTNELNSTLANMRMIKQLAELKAIQAAIDITTTTLKSAKAKLSKRQFEYELAADINQGFIFNGAKLAFPSIVASGQNACTIHYLKNNSKLVKNQFVLLDVGAEVENYAADISRTYAIGKLTKRHQDIHNAVQAVQDYAINYLKPRVLYKDYEKAVEKFMGEQLKQLGLIKTVNKAVIRKYFPHGTSHFLGLDVHDAGDYKVPFEKGMVLTVEPGIYIAEEGIGVRIEDDILLRVNGNKVLTSKLPRSW